VSLPIKKPIQRCYACTEIATSREHVPPKSFFPEGYRTNATVVPSCERHNNDNSLDVEYVRNILVSHVETSSEIIELLSPKVWRSFSRSPALLRKTFTELNEVFYRGERTGSFSVDIPRLNRVMSSIASGMYFHTFRFRFYGTWKIFSPSAFETDEIRTGMPGQFQIVRDMIPRLKFKPIDTPHPKIFSCGIQYETPHSLIFMFQFNSGIKMYALAVPFWQVRLDSTKWVT
jgi:hypothetical protein